ncbi:MAG: hypothetical protein AAFX81_15975 [Pseudomonadota bacterium]
MDGTPSVTLTAAALLQGTTSLKREPVELPDLGGRVFVRELTAGEVEDYIALLERPTGERRTPARLLAWSLCDEDGAPLFRRPNESVLVELAKLPKRLVEPIVERVLSLSALRGGDDPMSRAEELFARIGEADAHRVLDNYEVALSAGAGGDDGDLPDHDLDGVGPGGNG